MSGKIKGIVSSKFYSYALAYFEYVQRRATKGRPPKKYLIFSRWLRMYKIEI